MVSYLTPTEKPLKVRSEQNTLYIEYAAGGTEFKADFKNNSAELQKLKETLNPLTEGDLVTFKAINICGYASPDGSAKTNDRVATNAPTLSPSISEEVITSRTDTERNISR